MKCLVLGGNGFIGSHLVDWLLRAGHRVRVHDCRDELFRKPLSNVEYIRGRLEDRELLRHALNSVEVVFHLIGTTLPVTSNENPIMDVQSNVVGTLGLLEECVRADVSRLVFMSSGGTVYGIPRSNPIKESHPTNPICSYGITKLAVEKYLNLFYHLYGLEYMVLRCSNAYGPRQNLWGQQGAIGVFMGKVVRGEPITIWGDGTAVRDYIFVEDVARALVLAAENPRRSLTLNIGSGLGHSLNQVLALIFAVTGRETQVRYESTRKADVPANVLDPTLAANELHWRSEIVLKEGIRRTWAWIQSVVEGKGVERT
jgi:UDP-glucose 4-epimerase